MENIILLLKKKKNKEYNIIINGEFFLKWNESLFLYSLLGINKNKFLEGIKKYNGHFLKIEGHYVFLYLFFNTKKDALQFLDDIIIPSILMKELIE